MPENTYAGWLSLGERAPFPIPCGGIDCRSCLLLEFLHAAFPTMQCSGFVRDNPEGWTRFRNYLHQQANDGVLETVPEPTPPAPTSPRRITPENNTIEGWQGLGELAPSETPCSGMDCCANHCMFFDFLQANYGDGYCSRRLDAGVWSSFRDHLQRLIIQRNARENTPARAPIPVACGRIDCHDCQWRQFLNTWEGGFHEACLNAPPEAWHAFLTQLRGRDPHVYMADNTPAGWLAVGPELPHGNNFYCTTTCSDCLFNQFLRRTGRVNPGTITSCSSTLESPEGQTIWNSFREEMRRMLNRSDEPREIPAPNPVPTPAPTNHTNSGGDNMPLRASSSLHLSKLGMDPEFELYWDGRIVNASRHWFGRDYDSGEIGLDGSGAQIELRPHPATSPDGLVRNVQGLFRDFMAASSSTPRDLGIQGNHYPLGAHIHFGLRPTPQGGTQETDVDKFTSILDWALGGIILPLSGRARKESSYYLLSAWRTNDHGFEYRSLPSAIFANPTVLGVVLKACWNLGQDFFNNDGIRARFQPGDMAGWDRLRTVARLNRQEIDTLQGLVYNYENMPKRIRAAWLGESVSTGRSTSTRTTTTVPVQAAAAARGVTVDPNSLLGIGPDEYRGEYRGFGNGIFVRYNSGDTFDRGTANELNARLSVARWGHQVPGRDTRILFYGLNAERGEHVVSCNCNGRHYAPRSRMGSWRPLRVLCSAVRANEIAVGLPFGFRRQHSVPVYSSTDVDSLLEMIRFVNWQVNRRH